MEEVYEVIIFLIIVLTATFGFFGALRFGLNTKMPMVVVTSGSMEPTLYKGDLLFVMGVEPVDIKTGTHANREGDIIIYDTEGVWPSTADELIVHRVVEKLFNATGSGQWEFQAQGDANSYRDPPSSSSINVWIPGDKIVGIVVGKIPKIGWVKIWLSETGATIPLIIGLSLILVISIAWDLTHPDEEEKKKKKSKTKWDDTSLDDEEYDDSSVNLGV